MARPLGERDRAPGAPDERFLRPLNARSRIPAPWAIDALAFAASLVRTEGERLLEGLRPRRARTKGAPDDPVTIEDVATERRILRAVARLFPGHGRLGEEQGEAGPRSRYTWVLDPIDGTGNFAAGYPLFCVSLALLDGGRPLLAAVYSALERAVYHARRGSGAWRDGTRLRVRCDRAGPLSLVASNPSPGSGLALDPGLEGFAKARRLGSAILHFLAVASGSFAACVEERGRIWDLAAATLLVREAGGVVLRPDGRSLDRFEVADRSFPPIPCVAGSSTVAKPLLAVLRRGVWRAQVIRERARRSPPPKNSAPRATAITARRRRPRRRSR